MDDTFDTPWKEVVMDHFLEFMAFYFPNAHAAIDWSQPHVFLDQELAALSCDAELGKRVIDWIMRLPAGLEKRLRADILHLERSPGMTYLSSLERIGMEIGLEKGRQEGRQEGQEEGLRLGLSMQLNMRFGKIDPQYQALIDHAGGEQLTRWAKNFVHADHIEAVFHGD